MRSFSQQMQVKIGQHGREGIRVRHFGDGRVLPADSQPVIARFELLVGGRQQHFKYPARPAGFDPFAGDHLAIHQHAHRRRVGLHGANHDAPLAAAVHRVRPEQPKRVAVFRARQRRKLPFELRNGLSAFLLTQIVRQF